MAHWHDFNPWATTLVYLPDLRELSQCLNPHDGERFHERVTKEFGEKVDAYILPDTLEVGVRYGKAGSEYLSPFIHPTIASLLLSKYHKELNQ